MTEDPQRLFDAGLNKIVRGETDDYLVVDPDGLGGSYDYDYSKALPDILRAGELGLLDAQLWLMDYYCDGRKSDRIKAIEWGMVAVKQGSVEAMHKLASLMALDRDGVDQQCIVDAIGWFSQASEQGHAPSALCLGMIHDFQYVSSSDAMAALKWYHKAYELGSAQAMRMIGRLYEHGNGVEQDLKASVLWYEKALEREEPVAGAYLGHLYRDGRGVSQDFKRAMELYRANLSGESFYGMHILYKYGLGVECNLESAERALQTAATTFLHARALHEYFGARWELPPKEELSWFKAATV